MTLPAAQADRQAAGGPTARTPRLAIALSLLPFIYLAWLCAHLYVDVPFSDQFALIPRLDSMDAGTLTFNDVWQQHNEHRPMFPILIMLGLANATSWNIGAEIAVNVVLGAAIFVVCAAALRRVWPDGPAVRYWLLPLFSLVIFSPDQWENWLWGWQIQIFLAVLASLAGVLLLTDPVSSRARFAGAIACGVIATYSFAAGLTFWVVGAVPLWLNPPQRRTGRIAAWIVVGGATIASYLYDYHGNLGHGSMLANFTSLGAVWTFLVYTAKYLGAPAASYDHRVSAVLGLFGLMSYAALVTTLWPVRRRRTFLFPASIGLYTLASAVMTSLGRASFASGQATASRYVTLAAPLWVAVPWLALLWVSRRQAQGLAGRSPVRRAATALVLAAFSATLLLSTAQGAVVAGRWHEFQASLRRGFIEGTDDRLLARMFVNNAKLVRERRQVLKMLRMSVFREP